MIVKKKVKYNIVDYSDKETYEKCASICPMCGQSILDDQSVQMFPNRRGEYDWLYKMTAKKILFNCPNCTCQWEVKSFIGTRKCVKS